MSNYKLIRWIAYSLELTILYVISLTPNLIPEVYNEKPVLLIPFAISIAIFEGHFAGFVIGIVTGLLIDIPSGSVLGFHAIFLVTFCFFIGILTENLMKTNIINNTLFNLIAISIITVAHFFFYYVVHNYGSNDYVFINHYLPRAIYTFALSPIIYIINKFFAIRLTDE